MATFEGEIFILCVTREPSTVYQGIVCVGNGIVWGDKCISWGGSTRAFVCLDGESGSPILHMYYTCAKLHKLTERGMSTL